MRMSTKTETINGYVYCAYCGKLLEDPNIGICPEPPTICNCEQAKKEMNLYDQLRDLYNAPLAESIIEIKVNEYRNELLGKTRRSSVTTIVGSSIPYTGDSTIINSKDVEDVFDYARIEAIPV